MCWKESHSNFDRVSKYFLICLFFEVMSVPSFSQFSFTERLSFCLMLSFCWLTGSSIRICSFILSLSLPNFLQMDLGCLPFFFCVSLKVLAYQFSFPTALCIWCNSDLHGLVRSSPSPSPWSQHLTKKKFYWSKKLFCHSVVWRFMNMVCVFWKNFSPRIEGKNYELKITGVITSWFIQRTIK